MPPSLRTALRRLVMQIAVAGPLLLLGWWGWVTLDRSNASTTLDAAVATLRKDGLPLELRDVLGDDPPAEQNAATVYAQAFALLDDDSAPYAPSAQRAYVSPLMSRFRDAWRGKHAPEWAKPDNDQAIAATLADADVQRAIVLIQQAAAMPVCRWHHLDDFAAHGRAFLESPHRLLLSTGEQLVVAQAEASFAAGDSSAGWQHQLAALRLWSQQLRNSSDLLDHPHGKSIPALDTLIAHQLLPQPGPLRDELVQLLAQVDPRKALRQALDAERITTCITFAFLRQGRMQRHDDGTTRNTLRISQAALTRDEARYILAMAGVCEALASSDDPATRLPPAAAGLFDEAYALYTCDVDDGPLSVLFLPALAQLESQHHALLLRLDFLRTVCALQADAERGALGDHLSDEQQAALSRWDCTVSYARTADGYSLRVTPSDALAKRCTQPLVWGTQPAVAPASTAP